MDDVKRKVMSGFSSGQVNMNDSRPEIEGAIANNFVRNGLNKKNVDL